jgi:flagellar secretion chaperone FliS
VPIISTAGARDRDFHTHHAAVAGANVIAGALLEGRGSGSQPACPKEWAMLPNPYQQYRATKVETAGSVDLVVMLYQGAVRFTRQAIDALEQDDPKAAHTNFVRAQDIVVELLGSLNREAGGQIATQLAGIYDYSFRRLVLANVKKDPAPAQEVINIFRDLGKAWQQIAIQQRQAQARGEVSAIKPRMAAIAV